MRDEKDSDGEPFHPSSFIPHPVDLARLRTYPQHTRAWLPLLRSRPGGVHRHYVVRSPKSDNLSKTRTGILVCRKLGNKRITDKQPQIEMRVLSRQSAEETSIHNQPAASEEDLVVQRTD